MLLCILFVSYAKVMEKNLFVSSLQMFLSVLKHYFLFFFCYHACSFHGPGFSVSLSVLCHYLPVELLMKLIKLLTNLIGFFFTYHPGQSLIPNCPRNKKLSWCGLNRVKVFLALYYISYMSTCHRS